MFLKKYLVALEFAALIAVVGCANSPRKVTEAEKKEAEGRYVTNKTAVEAEANNYVEIEEFIDGIDEIEQQNEASICRLW